MPLHIRFIATGRINHNQAKPQQKQYNKQKAIIKIVLRLPSSFSFRHFLRPFPGLKAIDIVFKQIAPHFIIREHPPACTSRRQQYRIPAFRLLRTYAQCFIETVRPHNIVHAVFSGAGFYFLRRLPD